LDIELLAPGVQHGGDADVAAEPVAPELEEALRGALEEKLIELLLVGEEQAVKLLRQGEDAINVLTGGSAHWFAGNRARKSHAES
jgi:hypothetical protein